MSDNVYTVGTAARRIAFPHAVKSDPAVQKLLELDFPGLSREFHFPDFNHDALMRSLDEYHSKPGVAIPDCLEQKFAKAIETCAENYSSAGVQWEFPFSDGFERNLADVIEREMCRVKGNSTPGFPCCIFADSNRTLFDNFSGIVQDKVARRIRKILTYEGDYEEFTGSPLRLVLEDYRDPVRYFPKRQAQRIGKTLPRVIASVSVIDQIVSRCFFGNFLELEHEAYPRLFTKKGIGFNETHAAIIGEQFAKLTQEFGRAPVVSDVSGWEKNFTPVLAEATAAVISLTCKTGGAFGGGDRSSPNKFLQRALLWWSRTLFSCVGYVDSGDLLYFPDLKVQRSGDLLTTSSNGISRSILALTAGSIPFCMGDDCNEWPLVSIPELRRNYELLQLPLRDVDDRGDGESFDFCSHTFRFGGERWLCWLSSWQRTLFEASQSRIHDPGTDANWRKEVLDMPDLQLRDKILKFIENRATIICSGGHDEGKEKCPD